MGLLWRPAWDAHHTRLSLLAQGKVDPDTALAGGFSLESPQALIFSGPNVPLVPTTVSNPGGNTSTRWPNIRPILRRTWWRRSPSSHAALHLQRNRGFAEHRRRHVL